MPRRWHQVGGQPPMTVANKPGHWGEREVTVKTIACGNAGCSGVSVVTNACAFYFAHAAAGAWAPGIPHALLGETGSNGPDALRRGVVNACLDYGSPGGQSGVSSLPRQGGGMTALESGSGRRAG